MDLIELSFSIEKSDPSGKYVRGWGYVCKDESGDVVDYSGDVTDIGVIREAAHDFMEQRVAKAAHGKDVLLGNKPVGDIVESLIVDDNVAKALGITSPKRGWFIGMRINDASVQKAVRDGTLKQFSFGGRCDTQDLQEAA